MHRAWFLVAVLAGCLGTPGPTTVDWTVVNASDVDVSYTVAVQGGRGDHEVHGMLRPGQQRDHTMHATGDLVAVVALHDGPEQHVALPPGCDLFHLKATWTGAWTMDRTMQCQ